MEPIYLDDLVDFSQCGKHFIKWGDKTVAFYFYANKKRRIGNEICAICKEPITEGHIWAIVSNQTGVPNRQVHGGCFIGFEETFEKIVKDYERAKIHLEWLENSGWLATCPVPGCGGSRSEIKIGDDSHV